MLLQHHCRTLSAQNVFHRLRKLPVALLCSACLQRPCLCCCTVLLPLCLVLHALLPCGQFTQPEPLWILAIAARDPSPTTQQTLSALCILNKSLLFLKSYFNSKTPACTNVCSFVSLSLLTSALFIGNDGSNGYAPTCVHLTATTVCTVL